MRMAEHEIESDYETGEKRDYEIGIPALRKQQEIDRPCAAIAPGKPNPR